MLSRHGAWRCRRRVGVSSPPSRTHSPPPKAVLPELLVIRQTAAMVVAIRVGPAGIVIMGRAGRGEIEAVAPSPARGVAAVIIKIVLHQLRRRRGIRQDGDASGRRPK